VTACKPECKCSCNQMCGCHDDPQARIDRAIAKTEAEIALLERPQPDAPDAWVHSDPKWNLGGLGTTS